MLQKLCRAAFQIFAPLLVIMALGVDANAGQLSLSWTDMSSDENGFEIERKTGTGGTYSQIATVGSNVTSYTDPNLAGGSTYCYQVRAFNTAGDSPYSNEACGTPPQDFALTVAKAGTGSGTVSSTPAGITCGTDCSEPYPSGTSVTLAATPAAGSSFDGWSGGGCSGTAPCLVVVAATTLVTATLTQQSVAQQTFTLTVSRAGRGSGSVGSSPAGIICGPDCFEPYADGTVVTLSATPEPGSTFAGWSEGGCRGRGTCTVTLTADTAVTASFKRHGKPR